MATLDDYEFWQKRQVAKDAAGNVVRVDEKGQVVASPAGKPKVVSTGFQVLRKADKAVVGEFVCKDEWLAERLHALAELGQKHYSEAQG